MSSSEEESADEAASSGVEDLVAELVHILLEAHRTGSTVSRNKLSERFNKKRRRTGRGNTTLAIILERARQYLRDTFGITLVTIPTKPKSAQDYGTVNAANRAVKKRKGKQTVSSVHYILTTPELQLPEKSILQTQRQRLLKKADKSEGKLMREGFETTILSALYVNGGKILHRDLKQYFQMLDVDIENDKDPIFGDVTKLFKEMIARKVLYKCKKAGSAGDGYSIEYHIGTAAQIWHKKSALYKGCNTLLGKQTGDDDATYKKLIEREAAEEAGSR